MTRSTPASETPRVAGNTVRVSRLIRALREQVFDAWLTPAVMKQWWLNGDGEALSACEIDPRVGGRYCWKQIGGCDPEELPGYPPDYEWIMHGEFLEIIRPQRIVFTWNVNHKPPTVDNRVTVEFHERAGGTEVCITHEGILTTPMRDGTHHGWTQLLTSLAGVVERPANSSG